MNPMWLLRAKRWVQNPPPMSRVILVLGVIAVCILIYAAERVFGDLDAGKEILRTWRRPGY